MQSIQDNLTPTYQSSFFTSIPQKIISSITDLLRKITDIFHQAIVFPTRYFGSKSGTITLQGCQLKIGAKEGYHLVLTPLSKQETRSYVRYAATTAAVVENDDAWTTPFGYTCLSPLALSINPSLLPPNIQATNECFFDRSNGLKVTLFHNPNNNEIVICFGAIGSSTHELGSTKENSWLICKQYTQMFFSGIGAKMSIFEEARQLSKAIINACPTRNVKLVGMCMGGALAQYVGLQTETKAICFNSLAIGAGLQQAIGDGKLALADRYITHISCKEDWASGEHKFLTLIDRLFCAIGIRTPGNFGHHYSIPSAPEYKTMYQIHTYLFGSVASHLGYHYRTLPSEMSVVDRQT
jgi:hypothetical protein